MAEVTIPDLPPAISLTGAEQIEIVQAGVSKRATINQGNAANPANLPPGGLDGQVLVKQTSADYVATWGAVEGVGSVTQVNTGQGISGGPITAVGTLTLAEMPANTVLANLGTVTAIPSPVTPNQIFDTFGSTQGQIAFRGAGGWTTLNPGTSGLVLTTGGTSADPFWDGVGIGTVTSVAVAVPNILSVSGSPISTAGTFTLGLANATANLVFSGPASGTADVPTFRSLVGSDLPFPSTVTLGGVLGFDPATSQFLTSITSTGNITAAQVNFSDLAGTFSLSQFGAQSANRVLAGPTSGGAATVTFRALVGADLPNPGTATLGGIKSTVGTANFFVNSITTGGIAAGAQPAFTDLSGQASLAQLPTLGNNTLLGNVSGVSQTPSAITPTQVLDVLGANQGEILFRGASSWTNLGHGVSGQVLSTQGASADPIWVDAAGGGTVTQINTSTGVTGGPITSSGTISLASIASGTLLANVSSVSAAPTANSLSTVLDLLGSTVGAVPYRGSSTWTELAPGTAGNFLQSSGSGSTPTYASVNLASASNVSGTLPAVNGGTGASTFTAGDLLYADTGTTLAKLLATATGKALISAGTGTAPAWGLINVATMATSTLAAVNGGTGASTFTAGDLLYADTGTTLAKLLATATGKALISAGTGTAPAWGLINVASMATGILAAVNGGTGQSTYTAGDLLYAATGTTIGKIAATATGNVLTAAGTGTVPAWAQVALASMVSGVLPIANGGTAGTTAATAVAALGAYSKVAIGSFTRDLSTASGTQSVTTIGFTPAMMFLAGAQGSTRCSAGWSNVTSNVCLLIDTDANATIQGTVSIGIGTSANYQVASISSFTATGAIVTWTKNASPTGTGTVAYLAIG